MPKPLILIHKDDSYYITRSTAAEQKQSENGRFRSTPISKIPEGRTLDLLRGGGKTVTIDETADNPNYNDYEGPSAADIATYDPYDDPSFPGA